MKKRVLVVEIFKDENFGYKEKVKLRTNDYFEAEKLMKSIDSGNRVEIWDTYDATLHASNGIFINIKN